MGGVSRGGRIACALVFAFLGIALSSSAGAQSNPWSANIMRNNDMMQQSMKQYDRHQKPAQDWVRNNPPPAAVSQPQAILEQVEPPVVDADPSDDEDSGEAYSADDEGSDDGEDHTEADEEAEQESEE